MGKGKDITKFFDYLDSIALASRLSVEPGLFTASHHAARSRQRNECVASRMGWLLLAPGLGQRQGAFASSWDPPVLKRSFEEHSKGLTAWAYIQLQDGRGFLRVASLPRGFHRTIPLEVIRYEGLQAQSLFCLFALNDVFLLNISKWSAFQLHGANCEAAAAVTHPMRSKDLEKLKRRKERFLATGGVAWLGTDSGLEK